MEKLIMWCLHRKYKKLNEYGTIFYVKGTVKDKVKLLQYSEDPRVVKMMEDV